MEETIVSPIVRGIERKIDSFMKSKISLAQGFREELRELNKQISTVQEVLPDAEERQSRNWGIRVWVKELKDVVYDVDDLLEDISAEDLRRQAENILGNIHKVVSNFFSSKALTPEFRCTFKDVMERLANITNEMGSLNFVVNQVQDIGVALRVKEQTNPYKWESKVIGRDEEKEDILRFLSENNSRMAVITISGRVGVGKTTLAKLVYADEEVKTKFNPLMWAHAYHNFNLRTIIEDLLKLDNDHRGLTMEELQERLKRELEGQRSLIVLDKVNKLTVEQWNKLRDLLEVGVVGLLITTSHPSIADVVEKSFKLKSSCVEKENKDEEPTQSQIKGWRVEYEREKARKQIIEFLLNKGDEDLSTLCFITGSAKTTLVESVYNDESVKERFELLKWVHISPEKFNLKKIIECILGKKDTYKTLDRLQIELREVLKRKTFLLVLDDIVDMNLLQWDKLRDLLINDTVGNKVLITTHNQRVALVSDNTIQLGPLSTDKVSTLTGYQRFAHKTVHLKPLSVDDSWALFVENAAFSSIEQERHPELVQIGKEIMLSCWGVPWMVKILGGILLNETEEYKWRKVDREVGFNIYSSSPIPFPLLLSFDTLPSPIKCCFAYCAIFFTFHFPDRERLTQQWIAQGFITPTGDEEVLEDLANRYFDVLVSRSFFHNLKQDDYLVETRFEVHHLVRDLAYRVSAGECSNFPKPGFPLISKSVHHVSFSSESGLTETLRSLRRLEKLRTFSWGNSGSCLGINLESSRILFSNSRNLRVLDLSGSGFEELPSSIGELKHLRYLDLSRNIYLESLPSSLFKLYKLETLRMDACGIEELPRDISKLKKLRNLYACTEQSYIPEKGISALTSLRILHLYPIHNLKALPKSLQQLTALETLVLKFCPNLSFSEDDMKGLTSLRSLTIAHLRKQSIIPSGLQDAARSLSSLCFFYCLGVTTLPDWIKELTSLQRLRVEFCPGLTALPIGIRCLKELQFLSILGCPKLSGRCERESGEDWRNIAHVQEIHLDGRKIQDIPNLKFKEFSASSSDQPATGLRNKELSKGQEIDGRTWPKSVLCSTPRVGWLEGLLSAVCLFLLSLLSAKKKASNDVNTEVDDEEDIIEDIDVPTIPEGF